MKPTVTVAVPRVPPGLALKSVTVLFRLAKPGSTMRSNRVSLVLRILPLTRSCTLTPSCTAFWLPRLLSTRALNSKTTPSRSSSLPSLPLPKAPLVTLPSVSVTTCLPLASMLIET
ncbi:hypothetical protein D9M69_697010 [compost metagenome]